MTQPLKLSRLAWLAFAMLAYACSDDLSEEATLPTVDAPASQLLVNDVSLEKGYLKFASVEAFENFLGEENDERKSELLTRVKDANFTSWRENFLEHEDELAPNGRTEAEDILVEDEYISSLMNEDGILQIGKYLFKINVAQELVLALDEADQKHYDDLVAENTNDEKIMVFSTNDDVLPLLAEGSTGTVENGREMGLTCKQKQAAAQLRKITAYYGADNGYRLISRVEYVKLGVYFKLVASAKNQAKFGFTWLAQQESLAIETDAGYKPRCRSTRYKSDVYLLPLNGQ